MCGIVGLLVKKPELRTRLGELMVPMLIGMSERGPESAGLAVFTEPVRDDSRKLNLYSGRGAFDWGVLEKSVREAFPGAQRIEAITNHAVLTTAADPSEVKRWLTKHHPELHVLSTGKTIDLYKDIGAPADIARRYEFTKLSGSHLVGHTRMATESAVTATNAHPYTAGEDFCLVHNGSLSNPYSVRRRLEHHGIEFEGDCDTEAACRFLEYRMQEGDSLQTALQAGFEALDGFYTFLMGTADSLALVRDPFACKPAVVAETDEYVAIASEYRSLAKLPGVANASLFEPKPEQIYLWRTDGTHG